MEHDGHRGSFSWRAEAKLPARVAAHHVDLTLLLEYEGVLIATGNVFYLPSDSIHENWLSDTIEPVKTQLTEVILAAHEESLSIVNKTRMTPTSIHLA